MSRTLIAGAVALALVLAGTVAAVVGPATGSLEASADHAAAEQASADGATDAGGVAAAAPGAVQDAADCNATRLHRQLSDAVVTIRFANRSGELGQLSGWVYGEEGYVVTNAHGVIVGTPTGVVFPDRFGVQFADDRWRTAEVVGADPYSDLAVLRVDDLPAGVDPLPVANESPRPGQPVATVGSPLGHRASVTRGVVSGLGRAFPLPYFPGVNVTVPNVIQTDATTGPGSSGGVLVDCEGTVLGVTYASYVFKDTNYAIPWSTVRRVVPALVRDGTYDHPYIGVRGLTMSPVVAEATGVPLTSGVLVEDVFADGPAAGVLRGSPAIDRATGLPVGGDVIVAVDGTAIDTQTELVNYVFEATRPGESVTVTVYRDGGRRNVSLTVGTRPPLGDLLANASARNASALSVR